MISNDRLKANKPELLVPAGSLPVLKVAVLYGADAVYIGGEAFSLRANAHNFTLEEMREGVRFAHERNVRIFVTANIFAHNQDLTECRAYFTELKDMGIINNEVTFYELYDLDDTIGDSYTTTERIDYDTRDAAFVDVGGTCLVGENGQTHAQVIQDWFNTFAEDEDDEEYNPELQSKWHRPKDTEVESLTGAEYTVFGHILNDCIIIEDYNLNGVTMEDVISDIDKAGITYDKIYEYGGDEIQRVAKVVK